MVEEFYFDYNVLYGRDKDPRAGFCGAWVEDASEWKPEWLADVPVVAVGEYVRGTRGGHSSYMSATWTRRHWQLAVAAWPPALSLPGRHAQKASER
jgi:hypothetical protein